MSKPYVLLKSGGDDNDTRPPPPPPPPRLNNHHNNNPQQFYYPNSTSNKTKNNNFFKCICCCYCILFLIIIILALIALYFYAFYKPKIPSYNIDDLQVKAFDFQPDLTLKTALLLTVKVVNPNSKIGLTYGEDSSIIVVFSNYNLCSGKLPHFHQGHDNTTSMNVDLTGISQFGSGTEEALVESQRNQKIPLIVKVKVPLSLVAGSFPIRQFRFFVNINIVVDNLMPNRKIGILSSSSAVHIEF